MTIFVSHLDSQAQQNVCSDSLLINPSTSPKFCNDKYVQVSSVSTNEIENLKYLNKVLTLKLQRSKARHSKCISQIKDLKLEIDELKKKSKDTNLVKKFEGC